MGVKDIFSPFYDMFNTHDKGDSIATDDAVGGGTGQIKNSLKLRNNSGIFGIPYQFLPSVDRRLYSTGNTSSTEHNDFVGRKYAEKIMGRGMPLLFLTPCRQVFMEGFDKDDQGAVISELIRGSGSIDSGLLDKSGRYYSTEYATDSYYTIVNRMSTIMTAYMGIGDVDYIDGSGSTKKLKNLDWSNMVNSAFRKYFMVKRTPVFYVDGMTSISDSFTNSTMESSLGSSINSYADQSKEIRFLLGNDSALLKAAESVTDSVVNGIANSGLQALTETLTSGMIGDLATTGVTTVLHGGKMIFPKMWADSSFSRSYSFDIKLRSPDHDTVSIFINVIAPYLHLLALVMPKSIAEDVWARQSPNAYQSPFLVRAYAKGLFNINMGIITDLTATRGAQCEWNVDGLPTQIDITLTIEDLYSNLFMSDSGQGNSKTQFSKAFENPLNFERNWDLVTNTEFMDFLANLGGLNVATDVKSRKVKMLYYLTTAGAARAPASLYRYFENGISNHIRRLWDILN